MPEVIRKEEKKKDPPVGNINDGPAKSNLLGGLPGWVWIVALLMVCLVVLYVVTQIRSIIPW